MDYKKLTKETLDLWFDGAKFKTPPFKHQLASIAFALGENLNNVMFLHGIGTGKTKISLDLLYLWNITGRTLVICPNSVIKTWKDEIERHTDFSYIVLKGSREARWYKLTRKHADIWLINYEGLKLIGADKNNGSYRINPAYPKSFGFECIIIDECHKLKDPNTQFTKISQLFTKWSRYTILMTGTPIGRSVTDLFGQFLVLDNGKTFGTYYGSFLKHYFFKPSPFDYKWKPKRLCKVCNELYTNKLNHLQMHKLSFEQYEERYPGKEKTSEDVILDIISNKCLRYSRDECVDLPEKIYEVREIEPTPEQISITNKIILGIDIEEIKTNVEMHTQKLIQITGGFLIKDDYVVYEFQPNPKLNELEDIIEQIEGKFIIYHQYIHESKMIGGLLKDKNIKYEMVNGTVKNKEERIDNFIKNDSCRCLVAHPKTGGEGLNIQVANTSIFYSNAYIGSILREQAEGRTHRTGQKHNCLFIDIVMNGTIDEILYNSLKNKTDYAKAVLNYLQNCKGK